MTAGDRVVRLRSGETVQLGGNSRVVQDFGSYKRVIDITGATLKEFFRVKRFKHSVGKVVDRKSADSNGLLFGDLGDEPKSLAEGDLVLFRTGDVAYVTVSGVWRSPINDAVVIRKERLSPIEPAALLVYLRNNKQERSVAAIKEILMTDLPDSVESKARLAALIVSARETKRLDELFLNSGGG